MLHVKRRIGTTLPLTVFIAMSCAFMIGCPEQMSTSNNCATVTVERVSEDANNDESFSPIEANQCDVSIGGDVLEIDILDRNTGTTNPRVLFTLTVTGNSVPTSGEIDLTRLDDTGLPPALYQEFDSTASEGELEAAGPFWSSAAENAGTIAFSVDDMNRTVAMFDFTADNPSETGNSAAGTLRISGEVILSTPIPANPCGVTMPAAIMILLGLCTMRLLRQRRA